jgi:hypothetical protein
VDAINRVDYEAHRGSTRSVRTRLIKPAFFTNEAIVSLLPETQLLFIGLWTIADREGRLEDRPLRIKMQIFPAANYDVDAMLSELEAADFVTRYEVNGNRYLAIPNFAKHQMPHPREAASVIPEPCKGIAEPRNSTASRVEALSSPSFPSGSSIPSGSSEEVQGNTPKPTIVEPGSTRVALVFEHWKSQLGHPDAKLTPKRRAKILARIKEGYTVEQLCAAVDGCAASAFHQGQTEKSDGRVYDDLELICRSGEKVEQFIGFTATQGRANGEILRRTAPRRESETERRLRETVERINSTPEGADGDRSTGAAVSRLASG